MTTVQKIFTHIRHRSRFLFFALVLYGCNANRDAESAYPAPYANTGLNVKYVGSKQCQQCHEEIYDAYMRSEMGRSMSLVSDTNWIENISGQQPVYDAGKNFYYEVVRRDGKYYQREFRKEKEGSISHERLVEMQYVMGSGNNLRIYFSETGGMLYEHPLTWYTHKKKFDLSPGYRDFGNLRFARFASAQCISCHNSYLTPDPAAHDRYTQPFPLGVGCERCHGPGELHVKQALGEDIPGLNDSAVTIVNPKRLPFRQQMDVCQQCHLQGKALVLKKEDTWFAFRPGNLLADHRSVYFKAVTQQEVIEVGDSPQRLSFSECFRQSEGRLTCITCHNPHFSIKTFSRKHFNDKCQSCHAIQSLNERNLAAEHAASSDCVSCHMNSTGDDNTLHGVTNTDHWIRVNANKTKINWASLLRPATQPVTRLVSFLRENDSLGDERLSEAYLFYYNQHDPRSSYLDSAEYYANTMILSKRNTYRSYVVLARVAVHRSEFDKAIEYYTQANGANDSLAAVHHELGTAYTRAGQPQSAIDEYQRTLSLQPNDPSILESLGIQYYLIGRLSDAEPILERAMQRDPHNAKAIFYLGVIRATQSAPLPQTLNLFRRVLELDPDIENGHVNTGNVLFLQNKFDDAIREYNAELKKYPNSTAALVNLGKVYAELGNKDKAGECYRKALKINPQLDVARILLMQL